MSLMDEMIARVGEKTRLSPEDARAAVVTVLEMMDARLPVPFGGRIWHLVQGGRRRGGGEAVGSGLMFGSGC